MNLTILLINFKVFYCFLAQFEKVSAIALSSLSAESSDVTLITKEKIGIFALPV
ncbi:MULTISPECIES: hypothetical protein [unclassified Microcoleus]|uniref:hypothetical protein n=1 Tax=unclassified Microcoleus TaxID=2642155 RepID=UPI002FD2F28E